MLVEVNLKGEKVFPSQIRGKYAYEKTDYNFFFLLLFPFLFIRLT